MKVVYFIVNHGVSERHNAMFTRIFRKLCAARAFVNDFEAEGYSTKYWQILRYEDTSENGLDTNHIKTTLIEDQDGKIKKEIE